MQYSFLRSPRRHARLAPCALAVLAAAGSAAQVRSADLSAPAGSYIVRVRAEAGAASSGSGLSGLLARLTGAPGVRVTHRYQHALTGFSADLSASAVAALRRDPRVLGIYPDGLASIASGAATVEGPSTAAASKQRISTGISHIGAPSSVTAAIDGNEKTLPVNIAVVDTGIADHAELRIAGGWSALGGGWKDGNGHGTHVAGIVAAKDNKVGVVGVAPGARLWSVRVLGKSGNGKWSHVIAGLDWVADKAAAKKIRVANVSIGGTMPDDTPLREAVDRCVAAGVTVVVAAGNNGNDAGLFVPGSFTNVLSVSALADVDGRRGESAGLFSVPGIGNETDEGFFSLSNWGSSVTLIAPGVNIRSTYLKGKYAYMSGTSQATPHVSGTAALFLAKNPSATPSQVRQALLNAALPFVPVSDPDGIQEPEVNAAPF